MAGHEEASIQASRRAALPYVVASGLLTAFAGLLPHFPFAHLEGWKRVGDFVQGLLFGVAIGLCIGAGLMFRKYLKD
jgi:hypothetical protein